MEYCNPLYKRTKDDTSPLAQPDPYIIESGGNYYVYTTGGAGVHLYTSSNLADWQYSGICLSEQGFKEYWAPSVIEIDGTFYMYYSCMPNGSHDAHDQAIRVATCSTPNGQFKFVKQLIAPFSIDPHVVQTEGGLFMFYSVNDYNSERAGTYIVVDKMSDPFSLEGKPVTAVAPTLDEEIFQRDRFKKGQHWHTIEGAFYLREGDWHYLMYSGSAYTKESYFIGYAVAKSTERDLRRIEFKKMPSDTVYQPLLRQNGFVEGTGHNSAIKIGDSFYIMYHGRSAGNLALYGNTDSRTFRMDRLVVDNGRLLVVPTNTPQKI